MPPISALRSISDSFFFLSLILFQENVQDPGTADIKRSAFQYFCHGFLPIFSVFDDFVQFFFFFFSSFSLSLFLFHILPCQCTMDTVFSFGRSERFRFRFDTILYRSLFLWGWVLGGTGNSGIWFKMHAITSDYASRSPGWSKSRV